MGLIFHTVTAAIAGMFLVGASSAAPIDGKWNGDLRCGASPQNPTKLPAFSNPISMAVGNGTASITRNTDVVTENLSGKIVRDTTSLSGNGKFKAKEGAWGIKIDGKFSGDTFSGTGAIYREDGSKVRDCTVELAKATTPTQQPSQKAEAKPALVAANSTPVGQTGPARVAAQQAAVPEKMENKVAAPLVKPTVAETSATNPTTPVTSSGLTSAALPSTAPTAQSERVLTGAMKWGTADSCLEVQSDKKTYCYGFMAQGPVAKVLLGACSQGDKCTVTGTFDDDKEEILTVVAASASTGEVVHPAAAKTPSAVVPAGTVDATAPVVKVEPARGYSLLEIGLGSAVVIGLLAAIALFVRRKQSHKATDQQQTTKAAPVSQAIPEPAQPAKAVSAEQPAPVAVADDLTYRIVLNGIQPGMSETAARAQLAALFKATPEQVSSLLAIPGYIVKKSLRFDVATKYQGAITAAGGACAMIEEKAQTNSLDIDLPDDAADSTTRQDIAAARFAQSSTRTSSPPTIREEPQRQVHETTSPVNPESPVTTSTSKQNNGRNPVDTRNQIDAMNPIVESLGVLRHKISRNNAYLGVLIGFAVFAFALFFPWATIPAGMLARDGGAFTGLDEMAYVAIIPLVLGLYPVFRQRAVFLNFLLANIAISFGLLGYISVINRPTWSNAYGNMGSALGGGFWIGLLAIVAISVFGIAWSLHTPARDESACSSYDHVPWFRRNWFILVGALTFAPVTLYPLVSGEVYYEKQGQLVTYSKTARIVTTVLCLMSSVWWIGRVLGAN